MRRWVERILIGLLCFVVGATAATILHLKELWLWDIPRMTEKNELAIRRMDQDLPDLQELVIRLGLSYKQIQEEMGRILGQQKQLEDRRPDVSTSENQ
jgi:hypothetical protein